MGTLKGGFPVSGKVGGVVFRLRKTDIVTAAASGEYGPATDPNQIRTINKFRFLQKLAPAIRRIECLQPVWRKVTLPKHTINNTIHSMNSERIKADYEIGEVLLSPMQESFIIVPFNLDFTDRWITLELEPLQISAFQRSSNKSMRLVGVSYFSELMEQSNKPPYMFSPLVSEDQPITSDERPIFKCYIGNSTDISLTSYKHLKILCSVVFFNSLGGASEISNAIYQPI